jgi:DNA-binding NtrC family response regulator
MYASGAHDATLCDRLREAGWSVELISSAHELERTLRHTSAPNVGLLEIGDENVSAIGSIVESCLGAPQVHWIAAVTTNQLRRTATRELIGCYCLDYVFLPYTFDVVESSLRRALRLASLVRDTPHAPLVSGAQTLIGRSEPMQALQREIQKVAYTDAPLFIAGESGSGKELTARAVHDASARASGPFVAINCCAIPSTLVQSELFGHERGAFTDAERRKIGHIEAANGGTLFLDEIGDLPFECQVTLLRFAQDSTIQRLGSDVSIPLDVRIVSATHVDLEGAVRDQSFRFDLYHRLCVLRIDIPPLRDRGTDIHLLAFHLLGLYGGERKSRIHGFTPSALRAMLLHDWPGNVRELANRVRRAIVMADGAYIRSTDLGLAEPPARRALTLAGAREEAERNCLIEALIAHGNRSNEVAQELDISRITLYRLRMRHGLQDVAGFGSQGLSERRK